MEVRQKLFVNKDEGLAVNATAGGSTELCNIVKLPSRNETANSFVSL